MDTARLHRRVGPSTEVSRGTLRDYKLYFNKRSTKDGFGRANIMPAEGSVVEGVLFRVSEEQLQHLDSLESPGYDRITVNVISDGKEVLAETYTATPAFTEPENRMPSGRYLAHILGGAAAHGVPEEYVSSIIRAAGASR